MASPSRSESYRYLVDSDLFHLTPLAAVEAYFGNLKIRVHNISLGGMALIVPQTPEFAVADILDLSVSIRERAFPMQVEVKGIRGLRVSCAFMDPSPNFHSALREFLAPKFLGATLRLNAAVKDLPQALELVPGSSGYEAFVGQNQTGVLIWLGPKRRLLRLIAVSREMVLGWDPDAGLRTGKLANKTEAPDEHGDKDNVNWDRVPEITLSHYIADILLAWLSREEGRLLIEKLLSSAPGELKSQELTFPQVP